MQVIRRTLAISVVLAAVGTAAMTGSVSAAETTNQQDKKIIQRKIARLDRVVAEADSSSDSPSPTDLKVDPSPQTMSEFLTAALQNIDGYWSRTFVSAGLPEPQVQYNWLAPGVPVTNLCKTTDDTSEFYCPPDDTIYMSQAKEVENWNARGDFAVAYLVAHEFGHSIQTELGVIKSDGSSVYRVFQTELQADCFAGVWANSAYYAGVLDNGDFEEAIGQADVYGDYLFTNPQHHGTPAERVAAFEKGYNSGAPKACAIPV